MAAFQGLYKVVNIGYESARQVDEQGSWLHHVEFAFAKHSGVLRRTIHVQRDDIGFAKHRFHSGHRLGVAKGKPFCDVVENDFHAQSLSKYRKLRADVSVANNAERAAANLVGSRG